MKKKCTNSACRRVFTPWQEGGVAKCPHCGKAYPRLKPTENRVPTLVLTGLKPNIRKVYPVKKLRKTLQLGLKDCKLLIDRIEEESIVLRDVDPGHILEELADWESCGVIGRIDWDHSGNIRNRPKKRTYMVLLSGYQPDSEIAARQYLRSRGHLWLGDELGKLDYQRVVVSRNLSFVQASNMAAIAKTEGLFVTVLREHT